MTETNIIDKNIIDVLIYDIGNNILFYAYTAKWCAPCRKIKPIFIEIMSNNNFKLINTYTITKDEYKKITNDNEIYFVVKEHKLIYHNYIPFFEIREIVNEKNIYIRDIIQTSDETLFKKFLQKNSIIKLDLDDNF